MSRRTLRLGLAGSVLLVGVVVAVVAAVAGASTDRERTAAPAPREITLVARDMGFFLPGSDRPNPTLRVVPGERVLLRLVHREPGILHDLVVEALGFEIPAFREAGERTALLVAPEKPGRHEYVCSLHQRMMRGVLEVTAAGARLPTE